MTLIFKLGGIILATLGVDEMISAGAETWL